MGTLVFICPATGQEVSTGIGMNLETFKSLYIETVRCPHCLQEHQLAGIRTWLTPAENVELPHNQAA
jgi:hypothetical protein